MPSCGIWRAYTTPGDATAASTASAPWPVMITVRSAPSRPAAASTCCSRLLPASRCSTFGSADFMRVPLPAAMMTMSSAMLFLCLLLRAAASRGAAIIGVAFAAAALLGGCSAVQFGYSQAPTALWWWLDRHAGFDDAQEPQVRARIDAWLRWHRATQLPDYAALLARAGREMAADATPAQVCGWVDLAAARFALALDEALPAFAATAVTLTPRQVDRIERRFAKIDDEFREEQVEGSAAALAARRVERAIDRAEKLYGRLDAGQRAQVARGVAASPWDASLSLAERRWRHREVVALLRRVGAERLDAAQAGAEAAALARRLQQPPDEAQRAQRQRLREFSCAEGARLHNMASAAQRRTAAARLAGWEADLRALAAGAAAPAVAAAPAGTP